MVIDVSDELLAQLGCVHEYQIAFDAHGVSFKRPTRGSRLPLASRDMEPCLMERALYAFVLDNAIGEERELVRADIAGRKDLPF
jgi:hypothetical protein